MKKILILIMVFALSLLEASEKKDILIISASMGKMTQSAKMTAFKNIAKKAGLNVDTKFEVEIKKKDQLKTINNYKVVMFDSLAGARAVNSLVEGFSEAIGQSNEDIVILPIAIEDENPNRKNISIEHNIGLNQFWQNGGESNFINMAKYFKMNIFKMGKESIGEVIIIPKNGLYHPKNPDLVFKDTKEYQKFFNIDFKTNNKPIVGIILHRGSVVSGALAHINAVIEHLENKGVYALPFYTDISGEDPVGIQFTQENNVTVIDALINFQLMIIDHESQKKMYEKVNVPVLHALSYSKGEIKDWEKDKYGVDFPMIPMYYIIPETLGFTDSLIVSAQNQVTKEIQPIMGQIRSIANKAINISKLKRKAKKDKKVTIMFYNYPYGKNNMGASFMNIPDSLELVLKEMKKQGYTTTAMKSEELRKKATAGLKSMYSVNLYEQAEKMLAEDSAALYPYDEYIKEFYKLPVETRTNMIKFWGYPLESKMLIYKNNKWYFLVPRFKVGNIVIMPQPRRAEREDSIWAKNVSLDRTDTSLWHNPTVSIGHSYLAGYLYARNQFKTDALVHFGTHGTQEWSPGKERGLRVGDDALSVLGDVPVVYPYITNNLAEGIQAKRRGRATLISHQTPPYGLTGTYKELSEIMDFINQYKSADDGMLKTQLKEQITEITIKMNIHKDVEYTQEMVGNDFDNFLSKVEDYILGSSKQAMPLGMHTFGTYPEEAHMISTVMQMVGSDFIAKVEGDEKYFAKNYKEFNTSKTYKLVKDYVIDGKDLKEVDDEETIQYLKIAREYKNSFVQTKETKNFLRALDGEYIEGGVGGDPIRNPASIPTGNNMYGFDPSKVPTKAAYKTGSKLMKDFIENYYKENKKYPRKLTFNLWSLETMRHHGVLESQILYAMGVKPIWNETGISNKFIQNIVKQKLQNFLPESIAQWFAEIVTIGKIKFLLDLTPDSWLKKPKKMLNHAIVVNKGQIEDIEIIPYSELKRPRVDVVISATGLYRDTFPQTMKLIAKAVKKVSELKEANNFLRENTLSMEKRLSNHKDINASEAKYLSTIRIFSNKTGDYGSGVDDIDDTGRWETDKRISQNYVQKLGHYFGTDTSRWSEKRVDLDLYSKNLSGTEGIIFSRTSNLYGLLTSDDPFEYFGSIAMAVRNVDGKAPKTFIANLRDPKDAKIESTAKFMTKELRGRYFHPKWIKEMQKEGYSGTLNVQDVMNNFWGWQVVDPNVIRDDQWQEFVEVYVNDKYNLKIQQWFKSLNPDAYAQIIEKMLEANRKGYFKTDEDTLKKLVELYKELANKHSITKSYNEKFKKFVDDKAIGFGLMTPNGKMIDKVAKPNQQKVQEKPKVKGQKLEKVQKQQIEQDYQEYFVWAGLLLIAMAGVFSELRRRED
ncbi:MAG: cobaltochelatase subunit CobN [Campylobacterales bacterium]|nr:cobaltochelatase subunit CobN [Campylobacterales bacterium]